MNIPVIHHKHTASISVFHSEIEISYLHVTEGSVFVEDTFNLVFGCCRSKVAYVHLAGEVPFAITSLFSVPLHFGLQSDGFQKPSEQRIVCREL